MIPKQIIVIGGGGFHRYGKFSSDNKIIEEYILQQTDKPRPKVCFISTASGESLQYIIDFYREFAQFNCEPTHLSLFKVPTTDLESFILEQDVIYVGGGNTKSMLALWKEWNLHHILKKAWEKGIILAGLSAGSICWFEQGITDSIPGPLTVLPCLGFIKGSNCPHYDKEVERKPTYHRLLLEEKITPGIAIDDNVGIHFVDQEIVRIIKANTQGNVYNVFKKNGIVEESIISK